MLDDEGWNCSSQVTISAHQIIAGLLTLNYRQVSLLEAAAPTEDKEKELREMQRLLRVNCLNRGKYKVTATPYNGFCPVCLFIFSRNGQNGVVHEFCWTTSSNAAVRKSREACGCSVLTEHPVRSRRSERSSCGEWHQEITFGSRASGENHCR